MKAEMNSHGVITLTPENSLEAYALRQWHASANVKHRDDQRQENEHWRGSRLKVTFDMEPTS